MSGDFLDSNIIVYSVDRRDPERRNHASEIVAEAIRSGTGTISQQVIQEVLNVVTSRFATPISEEDVHRLLDDVLRPMWSVQPSIQLFREALLLKSRYQLHFYDALIVAAALQAGCDRLISEDFQHGQRFETLLVHNPFV